MDERTLVIVKPDGVTRGLSGEVVRRIERTGLRLIGTKMVRVTRGFAEKHYRHDDIARRHGERVWEMLLVYLMEGPVLAAVFQGPNAVSVVRKLVGATEPNAASPGTVRGDFGYTSATFCNSNHQPIRNIVHASATVEEATAEVSLWFNNDELFAGG